jgi:hypothetical protein
MAAPYARNKNAVAICNRSGQKMMRSHMVEDGYLKGLLVHPDWYDPYHPQERPFDPDEGIAIYKPAPDLMPVPPSPILAGNRTGSQTSLTWTQPDPPGSTVVNWTVWRNTQTGQGFILLATVLPIVAPDYMVQGPDINPSTDGIVGQPPVRGVIQTYQTGLLYTDTSSAAGYQYYVIALTADTSTEDSNGLLSAPSNTITV